jgi:hypothetical protein
MLRLFETSFSAVWDILENKWQLMKTSSRFPRSLQACKLKGVKTSGSPRTKGCCFSYSNAARMALIALNSCECIRRSLSEHSLQNFCRAVSRASERLGL